MLNKVLAKWFMGKELALAFGLNLGFARIGSALGMSMSPRVASAFSFNAALWLGAVVMLSGVILFLIFMSIDYREDKRTGEAGEAGKLADDEVFRLKDLLTLLTNKSYLLIIVLCASFYAVVFPFQDYLADLLQHKHGYDKISAGDFTSLIPYGAALFTIIFGAFIDKKGKRATLMLGGAGLLVRLQPVLRPDHHHALVLIPLFGIAFSLVPSAMWPAVASDRRREEARHGLWLDDLDAEPHVVGHGPGGGLGAGHHQSRDHPRGDQGGHRPLRLHHHHARLRRLGLGGAGGCHLAQDRRRPHDRPGLELRAPRLRPWTRHGKPPA